jgi:hypothetical protein
MAMRRRVRQGGEGGTGGRTIRAGMLLAGGVALVAAMAGCPAKAPAPPPAPAPTPAPAPKVTKDPAEVLAASREALGATVAMSYTASVEGAGALKDKVDAYSAQVIAAKVQAEGGGWKLYLKGQLPTGRPAEPAVGV